MNAGLSLVGVIVGEFQSANLGLGYLIQYGSQIFKMNIDDRHHHPRHRLVVDVSRDLVARGRRDAAPLGAAHKPALALVLEFVRSVSPSERQR